MSKEKEDRRIHNIKLEKMTQSKSLGFKTTEYFVKTTLNCGKFVETSFKNLDLQRNYLKWKFLTNHKLPKITKIKFKVKKRFTPEFIEERIQKTQNLLNFVVKIPQVCDHHSFRKFFGLEPIENVLFEKSESPSGGSMLEMETPTDEYSTDEEIANLKKRKEELLEEIKSKQSEVEAIDERILKLLENKPNEPDEDLLCCICMFNKINVTLIPCGHVLCEKCSNQIDRCPKCRSEISDINKLFL